ncbi:hypothetical protein GQX74_001978 [Glossina fuscipes]|nr:hypothetical protein GQX74_001978 [Glossina fuscipes]
MGQTLDSCCGRTLIINETKNCNNPDCDPDLKSSVAENLENLVNRLEKLVERLERSICARELEIANRTFDSVLEKKRESFDLESTELPPVPVENFSITEQTQSLNQRIERIEESLTKINERHSLSSQSASLSLTNNQSNQPANQQKEEGSLENIPTVLEEYQSDSSLPPPPPPLPSVQELESMSVVGYQDIVNGPLSQYLALSYKIGGDVAKQAEFVKLAFEAQLQYVNLATQCSQPGQDKQMALLKPTSDQITAIQDFREKNRASPFFNHLSAISESIPALGWSPTPGPHVKEMNDAGQFYTNRVLKEWKEKDVTHVEWARAWVQTLTELQQYIKQFHTTGLVWSGKGTAVAPPPPPMGACPPPPPPPTFDLSSMSLDGSKDERSALFAEINQGEAITKNLKKVTADMQTHKNPTLRTGPAPFKPTQFGSVSAAGPAAASMVKDPIFTRDGKKWLIEYQKNNPNLLVENAEMNNVVYVFKSEGSTLTVKGKVNNIVMDSCKKCSLLFDSVVASVEFVNCQSVQMQVLGHVPTISIDKTDGCQMYLSKHSLGVEVVSSKSSEMNIMLPEDSGDYTELPLPEQFKTTISGKTLKTRDEKVDTRKSRNIVNLLAILVDTNPSQRVIRQNPGHLSQILDAIIAFGNAHLMQKAQNKLAVLSCHHHATDFLYPTPGKQLEVRQIDGQYEAFSLVEKTVKQRLSHIICNAPKLNQSAESLLAGSLSMALCYIARVQRNAQAGTKIQSRILVLTGSNECASQYMTYMNVFFTAQKLGVVLDICALDKSLSLLQQGCDITGGQYLRLTQLDGLLQYLLWVFLPDPSMRQKLVLPPPAKVDYRAACFCHRELIDIGYVCSVCLSIFCKFSPICTTCHTVFKVPGPLPSRPKKKKKT